MTSLCRSVSLRFVTALSVWLAPIASLQAQTTTAAKPKASVLTSQSVAVIRIAPRRVLTSPQAKLWPTEVATAAGLQYVGIDPVAIEQIEIVIEPPLGTQLYYAAVIRFASPFQLSQIRSELLKDFTEAPMPGGRNGYKHSDPNGPLLMMANQRTLIMASEGMMKKLARRKGKTADGDFADWLADKGNDQDFHAAIHFKPILPLVKMGLAAAGDEIPAEARPFLKGLDDISFIEAWYSLTGKVDMGLAVEAADASGADRLTGVLDSISEIQRAQVKQAIAQLDPNDPIQAAWIKYSERVDPYYGNMFFPQRDGNRFSYELPEGKGDVQTQMLVQTAVIGILVALLLPAVQTGREAARRNTSLNQMKQLVLALHNHHDVNGSFPPQAITSVDGKPLLSWRVAILPFLEEQELYNRFHLDEAWNSPHNQSLLPLMPEIFEEPSGTFDTTDGKTHYLAAAGPQAAFDGSPKGRSFRQFSDGSAKTIAIVQVGNDQAVDWTKPDDYDVAMHDANPTDGIGSVHPGVFLAAFADGHVKSLPLDINPDILRAMLTCNGREPYGSP